MKEKNALIIGGSGGIGNAIVRRLARDGFHILATARNVEKIRRELGDEPPDVELLNFDVSDPAAIQKEYAERFRDSAPAAVVYNAGVAADGVFALMTPEDWRRVMEINLNGFFNTVQPLVMNMIANHAGRIVAIASISGQCGQSGQVNYSAAKAGLIGAVKALAREVGRKNILVNAVCPGVIDTPMTKGLPKEHILPLIPLKRYGLVEEVAGAVSFLCGPDSSYITGQVIGVNGGMYI